MQTQRMVALVVALLVLPAVSPARDADGDDGVRPQAQDQLKPMLRTDWSRGPSLPQGFQDSAGGFVGDTLITVAGYCGGGLEIDKVRKPGLYPPGFLSKAWCVDLSAEKAGWNSLPDFPGVPRQGVFSVVLKDRLYVWGGFNYTEPCAYADGWRLSKAATGWTWEVLPALAWPLTNAGITAIDTRIYVLGGGDYDIVGGFHTATDRHGRIARLGARLLVLDTRDLATGWQELPACPGTPRFVHATQAVAGRIYVIGGATLNPSCTVVDNWVFEPSAERWTRIRDLPVASGNFPRGPVAFRDRYILLPGGYQYGLVANADGTTRSAYGKPSSRDPKTGLYNDVFVYDTQTNSFGTADKLPLDNNLPMTVVRGDRIYLIGGETGGGFVDGEYFGHHPELMLVGQIKVPN